MEMQTVYRCCPGWMQRGEERGCLHSEYHDTTVRVCCGSRFLNSLCYPQECVPLAHALTEGSALRRVISFASVRKGSRECAANMVSRLVHG